MTKAEEAAFKAYPNILFPFTPLDLNAYRRGAFINGYEAAEKDLALTWEDVENIVHIYEIAKDVVGDYDIELYEEVLTRFKQIKEEQQ